MTRVDAREFAHAVSLAASAPEWRAQRLPATSPVRAGEPYRGFVRLDSDDGPRFGYVASRSFWTDDGEPVAEGLLYEVSPGLRGEPQGFPSNGRRFREIGEAMITNDARLFPALLRAYA